VDKEVWVSVEHSTAAQQAASQQSMHMQRQRHRVVIVTYLL